MAIGCEELTNMDDEAETKAIEEWLRMGDKPLATEEGDKKDTEPREERESRQQSF